MTRAEKVVMAQKLRAEGLKLREIAERMGAKLRTVSAWLNDPDLSKQKARRARYSRPCVDCGNPTDGSGGYADQRERCNSCARSYQHDNRYWTPETIVKAIRRFHRENGRVPTSKEWHEASSSDFPPTSIVLREFGRWKDAIRAAGFECYSPRQPDRAESAVRRAEIVRRYLAGESAYMLARSMDLDESSIWWHLNRAGVKARSYGEAARLRVERQAG